MPSLISSQLLGVLLDKQASRLDINSLAPSVQQYFQHGLAPSTRKSYQAAMKCFRSFCGVYNIFTPFSVTEQLLCSFAAFLADQGLAPQTVKPYLSAVRNSQISLGLPDPRDQSSLPTLRSLIKPQFTLHSRGPKVPLPLPKILGFGGGGTPLWEVPPLGLAWGPPYRAPTGAPHVFSPQNPKGKSTNT